MDYNKYSDLDYCTDCEECSAFEHMCLERDDEDETKFFLHHRSLSFAKRKCTPFIKSNNCLCNSGDNFALFSKTLLKKVYKNEDG